MRRDQGRRIADFMRHQSGDSTRLVTGLATGNPANIPGEA
jgi:hypothetical protein